MRFLLLVKHSAAILSNYFDANTIDGIGGVP
jgi:hypothetical protein